MERLWLTGGRPQTDVDATERREALRLYGEPAPVRDARSFFAEPPAPQVDVRHRARLKRGRREQLCWDSGYRTWDRHYQAEYDGYGRNRTAWAEAWRHEGFGRRTIVCVNAWMTGSFALQRRLYTARRLYESGLDVVLFMLPFHGPRNPAGSRFGGQLFPGTSPRRTNEAFGQTIWDLRSLLAWLQAEGSGPVGVMGMSLGGYTAAVAASVEPRLDFAVAMIPLVSVADLLWTHGAKNPLRQEAEANGFTLEVLRSLYSAHSPLELEPVLPRERLMLVAGRGDRICPPDHVEKLRAHWKGSRVHWFDGSHILHFGRRQLFNEVLDFVEGLPARPETTP